jgi:4'-phosphopantetheinyl transferase
LPGRDANVVHVWLVPLTESDAAVDRLHALLSPEERLRAARYHALIHRRRFIVRRARLRELVASYVGCEPSTLPVATKPGGKPYLSIDVDSRATRRVEFSASHSGELAAFAIGPSTIGIDLERITARPAHTAVAALFTPRERTAISDASPAAQLVRFFECWTCKEAYVKVTGRGLAIPLGAFDVSGALGREGFAVVEEDGASEAPIAVRRLPAPLHYALALAGQIEDHHESTGNPRSA